jgi:protein-S-isoprenylcysteine O-methyltransferase Ste14
MNDPIPVRIFAAAFLFERYVLSAIYFWFAYRQGAAVESLAAQWPSGAPFFSPLLAQAATNFILFLVQLLIGAFLLNSRAPALPPRSLPEIFVPLASCAYFVLYGFIPSLPEPLARNVFGGPVPPVCVLAGMLLGLVGPAISLWGVLALGKSFGIFVSVREVVLRGPYRFVRHPIYLGYFCVWVSLALLNLSPAIFLLVALHMLLFRVRARMEERRLLEASPAYGQYQRQTGFLFPRRGKS